MEHHVEMVPGRQAGQLRLALLDDVEVFDLFGIPAGALHGAADALDEVHHVAAGAVHVPGAAVGVHDGGGLGRAHHADVPGGVLVGARQHPVLAGEVLVRQPGDPPGAVPPVQLRLRGAALFLPQRLPGAGGQPGDGEALHLQRVPRAGGAGADAAHRRLVIFAGGQVIQYLIVGWSHGRPP